MANLHSSGEAELPEGIIISRQPSQHGKAAITIDQSTPTPKRLVICCDGTLNDGINTGRPITNVSRIARCIKTDDIATDAHGNRTSIPQLVFYMRGVATGTSRFNNLRDGVFGRGELPLCIPVIT
jgi:uncharacterized protein (DUF2235 family)